MRTSSTSTTITWGKWLVANVDRERILARIDELNNYPSELKEIAPITYWYRA